MDGSTHQNFYPLIIFFFLSSPSSLTLSIIFRILMVYYIFILLEATFLLRSGFTCKGEFSCGSNAFSHRDQA